MTTESECLAALRAAAEELGESPTKAQYEDLGLTPSASTILRVVGGWNAAKERAGLETNPSCGPRVAPKPDDVSLPDGASWADLSQDQRWHYRNVERNTQRTLERRSRLRTWLSERKRDAEGCSHCGETDPVCLDFHHEEPDEKTMAINEMVLYGYSREKLRAELEQCLLLCANCHMREHGRGAPDVDTNSGASIDGSSGERTPETRAELRAWARWLRAVEGCQKCGITDPRCLAFHHRNPEEKVGGIGAMISAGAGFDAVRREVAKCDVLCRNCHRKAHDDVPGPVRENDSV